MISITSPVTTSTVMSSSAYNSLLVIGSTAVSVHLCVKYIRSAYASTWKPELFKLFISVDISERFVNSTGSLNIPKRDACRGYTPRLATSESITQTRSSKSVDMNYNLPPGAKSISIHTSSYPINRANTPFCNKLKTSR